MKRSQNKQAKSLEPKGQSNLVLNIHIGHGLLCMHTPVRDISTNVIPNHHGEFLVNVEDATVFSVSGYRGNGNLGYVCVNVHDLQLYHCGK